MFKCPDADWSPTRVFRASTDSKQDLFWVVEHKSNKTFRQHLYSVSKRLLTTSPDEVSTLPLSQTEYDTPGAVVYDDRFNVITPLIDGYLKVMSVYGMAEGKIRIVGSNGRELQSIQSMYCETTKEGTMLYVAQVNGVVSVFELVYISSLSKI